GLPVLGWFAPRGGLSALVDAVFVHNLAYASGRSAAERLRNLLVNGDALWRSAGAACVLAGVGLSSLARERERWRAIYLAGWLVARALRVRASRSYFLPSLPHPLAPA